jgi:hypothetical protein
MNKVERLKSIVQNNLEFFEPDASGGFDFDPPDFELYAPDYLQFAEEELGKGSTQSLINCVGHLKRALDCQLDTFFHAFNLLKLFSERNLKFEKKLEFLKATGVFSSRSLARLNTIRNRMEHDYEVPKIVDIEVYFDLASAFVSILERVAIHHKEVNFGMHNKTRSDGYLSIEYEREIPRIKVTWESEGGDEELIADAATEIEVFAAFFKVLLLLSQKWDHMTSDRFLISQLNK